MTIEEEALERRKKALEYVKQGDELRVKWKREEAVQSYTAAIDLVPDCVEAYIGRGDVYCNHKGDYASAIADYTKAIELKPKHIETYVLRGKAYDRVNDYDSALADYAKAIELCPNYINAYRFRADTYRKKCDFDKADADSEQAIELIMKYADRCNDLAVADYMMSVDIDDLLSCCEIQEEKSIK